MMMLIVLTDKQFLLQLHNYIKVLTLGLKFTKSVLTPHNI